jgi:hypothetical protein
MKLIPLLFLIFCVAMSASARTVTSTSRQFSVTGGESGGFFPVGRDNRPGLVTLEPELLTVSAERIKSALLSELHEPDRFQGRIQLFIRPVGPEAMPIGIVSTHYADGWQYTVEVPERVDEKKLLAALVDVLLAEMSNRTPGDHAAELPAWFVFGMAEQLAFNVGPDLIARRNLEIGVQGRKTGIYPGKFSGHTIWQSATSDRLRDIRDLLRTNAPVSFRELTLANGSQFMGSRSAVYLASAQLLVKELLRLDPPKRHASQFLGNLSRTWNWQTSFYASYQPWFTKPLDAEKWWSLTLLDFTGQQQAMTWDIGYTMQRLESLLMTSAELRIATNDLPHRASLQLPTLVRTWRIANQVDALRPKIGQLEALEYRSNPFAVELIHDYRIAIQTYLDKVEGKDVSPGQRNDLQQRLRVAGIEFLQQLDRLDTRRQKLLKTSVNSLAAR